jgi:hypothetical protein
VTEQQWRLIDRTLAVAGGIALAALACWIAMLLFEAATRPYASFSDVIPFLLLWDKGGFVTYPLVVVGAGGLWLRKFLRARRAIPFPPAANRPAGVRCPSCGIFLPTGADACPDCGRNLAGR